MQVRVPISQSSITSLDRSDQVSNDSVWSTPSLSNLVFAAGPVGVTSFCSLISFCEPSSGHDSSICQRLNVKI